MYHKRNGPKPNKGPKQFQPQNEKSFQQNDKANKNKGKKTDLILDSTNHFQWWSYIMDLLRSKGLYRIASGQETKQKDEDKADKWENRQDQAHGLIGMSISPDLKFHIAELDTPEEAMK